MVTENARCRKVAGVRFFARFAEILRKFGVKSFQILSNPFQILQYTCISI